MSWYDNLLSRFAPQTGGRAKGVAMEALPAWTTVPATQKVGPGRKPTGPASFPRFHFTAGDQLDSRMPDRFAGVRVKLRNAFTPSQPITDRRRFSGRSKALATVIRAIEDQRVHTVIYGERGIGKTSMLHVLAEAAREARYLVVYISCGAGSDFDEMFRAIADDIPLLFHSAYGPTSPEAERGETLADLLPEGPISVRIASDMLHNVIGTRVLVILDEFDRIESETFRHAVAELLKSLSDRSVRVQVVIAGVAANLNELIENVPSIQRNIFTLQAPKMTPEEIRELVKNGEEASGLAFDESAISGITARSIGFPYLASLLSHRSGLLAIDDARMTVTGEDVAEATAEAVRELEGRITRRSQLQIADCAQAGALNTLGALAGAALYSGGQFSTEDVDALQGGADGHAKAHALIDQLAANGALIGMREDEFGRTYRFLEDTVPAYLWLFSAQSRFAARPAQPAKPQTADA